MKKNLFGLMKNGLILAVVLFFLISCTTLGESKRNIKFAYTSFWFVLSPLELTYSLDHKVTAPRSYNFEFDGLYLKCEILLETLEKEIAQQIYAPISIGYEIEMTLAMIDSRDPIASFGGPHINMADPAFKKLQEYREKLVKWQEEYPYVENPDHH